MTLQLERVKERLCKINSAQDKERDMYKAGDGRTDETIQSILIRHQDDRTALIRSEQVLTINEVYILDRSQHWSIIRDGKIFFIQDHFIVCRVRGIVLPIV